MRKRWPIPALAALLALPLPAVAGAKKKMKLRPLNSPANTAIQSDFPQMQGSGFQDRQSYSPSDSGSRLTGDGVSGVVPTSTIRTKATLAAPAQPGASKAYGQMRTTPVNAPNQINSQAHQPGTAYGAPVQAITGGDARTTGAAGITGPARPDMIPQAGPRGGPAGVSENSADAEIATVMSTINGVEKNIERREKEQEKKKSGEKGESKGMQPPQMPQGGGEEEKENGGGGGGEAKNAPQQDPDQYEPEPRSGLTDAKGADAQPAPSDTALNPAGNEPASFLNEPLSAQEMAVIGEGAAGRNNLIDQLNNVDQWDAAAIDRQIPMHSQRTASALKSGAGNAQSAQTTLSSSKASADTTVKNIGGQNKVNESKANQYKERAQQLSDVADSAQVDAPQCTPKPVTFSRPSRGRIDSAKRSHGRFRSQLGQAAAPISGLGGDVAALNASVPHLLDYAGFSAKRGSGNAAAADPAEAWRKEYIRQHNNLRESKQLGEAAEKDAGSALESSESATRDLEQTQQEGQTANQSINQLCEQFNSQLKPLYDKGKAQEKAGQAKQKQGEAEVQAGEALNIASPGAGTSLIRQGSNNIQEGRKLEQDGKKMRQEAVKKAKDLKTQMKQKAQKIKQRVQQTKQRSHQARQPHQHADRSNRGFRVPAYMK